MSTDEAGRLGAAAEYLVAATSVIASDYVLNVSTAMVDDEGVDMVFHRYGGTVTMPVQIKARRTDKTPLNRGQFQSNVRNQTFHPRRELHMLFVAITPDGTFDLAWLVPSETFADMASPNTVGRRTFQASMSATSQDRWTPWRYDRLGLVRAIEATLRSWE